MGRMKEEFMRMREKESFELMSEEEFEDSIHDKYGYGIYAQLLMAEGEKPTINDLDNLFNCADDGSED